MKVQKVVFGLLLLLSMTLICSSCADRTGGLELAAPPTPADPFSNPGLAPTTAGGNQDTGRFGCSRSDGTQWHGGVDLRAAEGTDFASIYDGSVFLVRICKPTDLCFTSGLGSWVIIRTGSGPSSFSVRYAHIESLAANLEEGDPVKAGEIIGKTGKTGNASGVPIKHLHIEISRNHFPNEDWKNLTDPEPFLKTKYSPPNPAKKDRDVNCPALSPTEAEELQMKSPAQ